MHLWRNLGRRSRLRTGFLRVRIPPGAPKLTSGQGVDSDPRASEAREAPCKSAWPDQNFPRAFGLLVKVDASTARNDLRKSPALTPLAEQRRGRALQQGPLVDLMPPETIMAGPGKRRASELWIKTCRTSGAREEP